MITATAESSNSMTVELHLETNGLDKQNFENKYEPKNNLLTIKYLEIKNSVSSMAGSKSFPGPPPIQDGPEQQFKKM